MKKKFAFVLAVLLAAGLAGCGVTATAPAASTSSSAASPAASMLAEKPTAEEVAEHVQNGKPNWVGRTITCAFDETAKTCVTTIAVDNGRKMLDQALTSEDKMKSFTATADSYAKYNAQIAEYLTSGGYDGFACTMVICDAADPSQVIATVDASNTLVIAQQ